MATIVSRVRSFFTRRRGGSSPPQTTGGMSTADGRSVLVTPSGEKVGTASTPTTPAPDRRVSGRGSGGGRSSGGASQADQGQTETDNLTVANERQIKISGVGRRIAPGDPDKPNPPANSGNTIVNGRRLSWQEKLARDEQNNPARTRQPSQPTVTEYDLQQSLLPNQRTLPPEFVRRQQSVMSEFEPVASGSEGGVIVRSRKTGETKEVFELQTSAYSVSGNAETVYGEYLYTGSTSVKNGSNARDNSFVYSDSFIRNAILATPETQTPTERVAGFFLKPIYSIGEGAYKLSTSSSESRSSFRIFRDRDVQSFALFAGGGVAYLVSPIAAGIAGASYSGVGFYRSPSIETGAGFALSALPGLKFLSRRSSSSVFLGKSVNVASTETGYVAESAAIVQTTQRGVLSNQKFLSVVRSRTFYQFEGDYFTAQTGSLGASQSSKGVSFGSGKNVYAKPKIFGSVAQTQGVITNAETGTYLSGSAIKTQYSGGRPFYSAAVSGGYAVDDTTIFSAGRTVPYVNGRYTKANRGAFGGLTKIGDFTEPTEGYSFISRSGSSSRAMRTIQQVEESNLAATASSAVQRSASPTIVSSSSSFIRLSQTNVQPTQSAYYGKGQYERTDFFALALPGTRPRTGTTTTTFQFQRDDMVLSNPVKQLTRTGTGQRNRMGQQPVLAQPQPTTQQSRQFIRLRLVTAGRSGSQPRAPFTTFVPYLPQTPFLPPGSLGDFAGLELPSNVVGGGRKSTRYAPSFSAIVFRISGSYKAGKLSRSGLDFRPITRGFRFTSGGRQFVLV